MSDTARDRVRRAKAFIGSDLPSGKLNAARAIFVQAWCGFFKSPNFLFGLVLECLKAVGLKIWDPKTKRYL